jgi:AcrR family transcriptional regulator
VSVIAIGMGQDFRLVLRLSNRVPPGTAVTSGFPSSTRGSAVVASTAKPANPAAGARRGGSGDSGADVADGPAANGNVAGTRPRRSGLVQERSRQTRQRLVRAAIELWTARGFEDGIESTTVEEIVQAAGVTKGTFYFHFAHKEDILLEVGWGTSDAMLKEATAALARDLPLEATLDELLAAAARRVATTPRVVVARTLEEFHRRRRMGEAPGAAEHGGFQGAYAVVLSQAQARGELPSDVATADLAEMLQALTMGAIQSWVSDEDADLLASLRYRAAVLLAGVREVASATTPTR